VGSCHLGWAWSVTGRDDSRAVVAVRVKALTSVPEEDPAASAGDGYAGAPGSPVSSSMTTARHAVVVQATCQPIRRAASTGGGVKRVQKDVGLEGEISVGVDDG